ncbi:uncharacterized protein LOC111702365 isoform X2 [Eurytemora carolleeae]|uniref:uncharacterized protein LOC111702365 isoform X2 n=1 Tax=Eurytemora carolleeae TaxID=1294199 RepID=UPI000C766E9B|nr:uncharacterized protein LOC111702365 isoform X2 [Eurytemora carolleeae]|eukprot:XP_023329793.1 uncharacterized protein LOC111702365 isoform X2 [Eurytemora affinis]
MKVAFCVLFLVASCIGISPVRDRYQSPPPPSGLVFDTSDSKHSDVSKTSSNTGNKFHIDEIPPPIILVLNSPGEAAAEEREVGEEGKEAGKEGREAGEEMRQELDVSADENIQTETVNEGWHASLAVEGYNPMVNCLISSKHNKQRYLYCPSLESMYKEGKGLCCGDIDSRYCCSTKEWRATQLKDTGNIKQNFHEHETETLGEHIKADVEEIEESLPGWAIALITIGCLLLGAVLLYILFCVLYKFLCCSVHLLCCCCCSDPEKNEEHSVLIRETHHHNHHTHYQAAPLPPPTMYQVVSQPVQAVPALYANVTSMPPNSPPPRYEQPTLYPKLS